jgi:putative ABC transport system permease protein
MTKIKNSVIKLGYRAETLEEQIATIRTVVNAITGTLILFGSIALIAASFGIINTLFMSVQERTREIGLMKAMGLSRSKVFSLFSIEAILIGFFGSLFGILAAMAAGNLINDIGAKSFLEGMEGLKLIALNPIAILGIMCLIMFIAFLAGTLPARRAAKLDPIAALRYE